MLVRGLYGMKQAGCIWHKTMQEAMISWGFEQLSLEYCIYHRASNTGTVIAAVHVNDFLFIADTKEENEQFKAKMKETWTISNLGEAKFCVGISISQNRAERTVALL